MEDLVYGVKSMLTEESEGGGAEVEQRWSRGGAEVEPCANIDLGAMCLLFRRV